MIRFAGFKKAIATVLSAAMILTIAGAQDPVSAKAADKAGADEVTLQVLQTSDLHGKFVPYNYPTASEDVSGSLAQIATLVKEKRAENANTLLIDCGDTIQDNLNNIFNASGDNPMIVGMNMLKYDAVLYGNHEFNYGIPTLRKLFSKLDMPVLCDNVYDTDGKTLLSGKGYEIYEKGGVRVAVIGSVTPNIQRWDAANLKAYKVTDPVEETVKIVNQIKKDKSADVIIVASHMMKGNEYGVKDSGYDDMAKALSSKDVPLILAAHGHTATNEVVNGIHVLENKNQGKTLGVANITLKKAADGTYSVTNVTTDQIYTKTETGVVKADPEFVSALSKYDDTAKKYASTQIGTIVGSSFFGDSDIEGVPQPKVADSPFLDFINAVQLKNATGARVSAAAFFSDDVKDVVPGPFKVSDTANIYKFDNTLYKIQISGKALKEFMEWSASYYNTPESTELMVTFNPSIPAYNYDTFSGVDYEINISKPAGSRIENLVYSDTKQPVKDDDQIVMAVNNYRYNSQLSNTGAGVIKDEADLPKLLEGDINGGEAIRDMIRDYVKNDLNGVIEPAKFVDNNWKVTGKTWNSEVTKKINELVKAGKLSIKQTSKDGKSTSLKAVTVADLKAAGVDLSKVVFDANGGKVDSNVLYVVNGKPYGDLPIPTREGYDFAGWYTAQTDGTLIDKNSVVAIAGDTTLFARWTEAVKPVTPASGSAVTPAEPATGSAVTPSEPATQSAVTVKKAPAKVTLSSVKSSKKGTVKVTFKKASRASKYVVYYSYNKSMKSAKKVTLGSAKRSTTIKKLTSGKKVYVRVRAYNTVDGTKQYGKYSAVKSVKVK